jgi:hypothetical protein
MSIRSVASRAGTLALTTAIVATIGLTAVPRPAHALGTGAAVGIGLGALAVGTALGAAANPYYPPNNPYPPYYYYGPAQPTYPAYPSGACWSPYYNQYVPC